MHLNNKVSHIKAISGDDEPVLMSVEDALIEDQDKRQLVKKNSIIELDPKSISLTEKYIALENTFQLEKEKDREDFAKFYQQNTDVISVGFKDLNIWAYTKKRTGCCKSENQLKWILHNLSGKFEPGTLTAIIGPSGSGKTTLLNFLSQRLETSAQKINGDIFINGEKMQDIDKIRDKVGYVTQFDDQMPKSTVEENFRFVANLIYSSKLTKAKIDEIIEATIKSLRLQNVRNTIVGSETVRGLSGGERKRVSVGIELITNPSILFMDEPTTGLDATTALEIMEIARMLAEQNKTVITTIHQPSFEILDCFDNILCLVQGCVVYWGPPRGIPGYFANMGLNMPPLTNPADYVMRIVDEADIIATNDERRRNIRREIDKQEVVNSEKKSDNKSKSSRNSISRQSNKLRFQQEVEKDPTLAKITKADSKRLFKERVDLMIKTYHKYKNQFTYEFNPNVETKLAELVIEKKRPSFCYQFRTLLGRNVSLYLRDPLLSIVALVLWVFFGFFQLIQYADMTSVNKDTVVGISDRAGAMFAGIATASFIGLNGASGKLLPQRAVYKRELASNLYNPIAFYLSNYIYDLPVVFLCLFIFMNLWFWVTTLENEGGYLWLLHYQNIVLTYLAANSFGYILAAIFKSLQILNMMFPIMALPFFIVSGFMAQVRSMGGHLFAYSYLSMFKWGFQAGLCLDLFREDRYITYRQNCVKWDSDSKQSIAINYLTVPRCDAKNTYNFYENFDHCEWFNMGMNFALFLILLIFGVILFYFFNKHNKIAHDELPSEIKDRKRYYDGTDIEHEEFDWKKAKEYLIEQNTLEEA